MDDGANPIAWLALKKGTPVKTSDGAQIGTVARVIADEDRDIFSGIAVTAGLFESDRFVPADAVEDLTEAAVHLALSQAEVDLLGPYEG